MLIENCIHGLKVVTNDTPIQSDTREDSTCCRWEDRYGYLLVYGTHLNKTVRLNRGDNNSPRAEFNIDQVEPFSLSKRK